MASAISVIPEESAAPILAWKRCRISIFQPNHFGLNQQFDEILIHKDDFPWLEPGDVVEIYYPENEEDEVPVVPRLLMMITKASIYPDNGLQKPINRDTVHIEKSVAETFQLPNYMDIIITKVDKQSISLDSVELTFKEQYIGRSEMWRLTQALRETCVYLNKKVDLCQGHIRCVVNELWAQGERVSSGMITNETKLVFRSPTAMVYLFIQMSSEMWHFDVHGELFFEKAVNGFLTEMFERWEKNGSSHEVTIVLFSRCFYKARNLAEFPERMRDCLQTGYNNSYYEDFYRVVVQNERFDDWSPTLRQLKQIFTNYKKYILDYHKSETDDEEIPEPFISSAAQGNFLEVLNISLNTFEHHYLNRNLDRTGQQSIVITPGVGIFEVDRELTMITKQRIIDSGVGSDLICVGEQPLHAVPLFKYHHKDAAVSPSDDFSMPHWINLSFYSKGQRVGYSNFKSRITIPNDAEANMRENDRSHVHGIDHHENANSVLPTDIFEEADTFDDALYELPNDKPEPLKRKMSDPELSLMASSSSEFDEYGAEGAVGGGVGGPNNSGVMSPGSDTPGGGAGALFSSSWDDSNINTYMEKARKASMIEGSGASGTKVDKMIIGSIDTTFDHQAIKKYLLRPGRALINPFDPSQTTVRLTSNRRRWTHIFPKGPSGQYQQLPHSNHPNELSEIILQTISQGSQQQHQQLQSRRSNGSIDNEINFDQVWNTTAQTGVDWRSLAIPASLPITTDYFPDPASLVNDYVVNEYDLIPEEIMSENPDERSPLDTKREEPSNEEVFTELVSQRLAQGFQLILLTPQQEEAIALTTATVISAPNTPVVPPATSRSFASKLKLKKSVNSTPSKKVSTVHPQLPPSPAAEFWLSIGRIFHRVSLSANKSTIKVTRYRPRQPFKALRIQYRYRFGAPDNDNYEVSWVDFRTEKLENFNWNHMDFYVCTRGDREFLLTENLKYWRFRLIAIPLNMYIKTTKKIMENTTTDEPCDIYDVNFDTDTKEELQKGFLRFIEVCLNRIKKPITMMPKRSGQLEDRQALSRSAGGGLREHRANTISIDRAQMLQQQKRRHPSGGKGSIGILSMGLSHLSPETKGSTSSMEQSGSFETHYSSSKDMDGDQDYAMDREGLKLTSTLVEIADSMKNGLTFVNKSVQGMPPSTFIAFEAVNWILNNVEGVDTEGTAVRILKNMQEKRIICHASGSTRQPFVNGFYFFYMHPNPKDEVPYKGNLDTFRNDWIEVEFSPKDDNFKTNDQVPEFLHETMSRLAARQRKREALAKKSFYKTVTMDVDPAQKSDRKEWGHLKYQHYHDANEAFDLAVQWTVSSGAIVSDLLQYWARKSQTFGFSLMPVPSDPFALPITQNSDPVRGPIFIELDTDCLMEDKTFNIFEDFPESSWDERLFLFREAIAHRFGFINSAIDRSQQSSSVEFSTDHQYIHCTGNMFLLIPTQIQKQTGIQGIKPRTSVSSIETGSLRSRKKTVSGQGETTIFEDGEPNMKSFSRHLSQTKPTYDHSETGFLWSWNFMISRRWKMTSNTGATGEIAFMDKMLADFRAFCRNENGRLCRFWQECWQKYQDNAQKGQIDPAMEAVSSLTLSDH